MSDGKIVLTFSNKVKQGMTVAVNLKTHIIFDLRTKLFAVLPIVLKNPLVLSAKLIAKLTTLMHEGKLVLLITPTLAHFYTLGYFDPNPLSVEDVQTLGQMDYAIL